MKITNSDIKLALDGAHALSQEDLPFATALLLHELVETLTPKARALEVERVKLVKKYGKETKEGCKVPEGTAEWEAFQRDWVELVTIEQEVDHLPEISTASLGDLTLLTVKAAHVGALRRIGVLVVPTQPAVPPTRKARRKAARDKAAKG